MNPIPEVIYDGTLTSSEPRRVNNWEYALLTIHGIPHNGNGYQTEIFPHFIFVG